MDFLNKQNMTYIIILLFILLAMIHLFNMKESGIESFITLIEDQNFSPEIKTNIPSTDLVQFSGIGSSTEPNNLTTILNSKLGINTNNTLEVPNIRASKINMGFNERNTINCPEPMFISTTGALTLEATNVISTGTLNATNGISMTGSGNSGIGGNISIINTDKTGATEAFHWSIYNMRNYGGAAVGGPGKPGSGLSFWRYAKDKPCAGNMCHCHMTLNDDGSTFFSGPIFSQDLNLTQTHNSINVGAWGIINGGRVHIRATVDDIYLMAKNTTHILKSPDWTSSGHLNVGGDIWSAGNISTGGAFYSTMSRNEGGQISILNPIKTNIAGLADNWTLFNMTDRIADKWKYPNGLNFYKYGKDLTTTPAQFILLDNGSSIFNGPLSVSRNLKNAEEPNEWHTNVGTGTFVVRCDSVEPSRGCLRIETTDWGAGNPTTTYSTINCKGRLHINSDESVLLVTKGTTFIHKRDDIGATGNLDVQGNLIVRGTSTGTSDRRLKENIATISKNDKDKVLQLVPKTYNMKDDEKKSKRYGLIAQEVEELYPEFITEDHKGMKSMNYIDLIPLLLEQIKELKKSIPNTEIVNTNVLNIGGVTLTANELLKLKQLLN
jgi:hypothetical protein